MTRDGVLATVAGLAGAAAVFAVMFWVVDAGEVLETVSRADLPVLAVVAGAILLWNLSWGCALWSVLRAMDVEVPLHLAALVHAAAAFSNHVTPFGQAGGEPITAWLLSRSTDAEYEVSLASIASLDAVNVVPSVAFAAAGALYLLVAEADGTELGYLPVLVLAVAVVLPVLSVAVWRSRQRLGARLFGPAVAFAERAAGTVPRLRPGHVDRLQERVGGFVAAVERLTARRRLLLAALVLSALGWALQAVGLWVTFLALDSHVPVFVPFFVVPLSRVGSAFPTPGGLGGTEAISVTLLALLTTASAPTIAAAVTLHGVGGYLLTTTVGAAAASTLAVGDRHAVGVE